MQNRQKFNGLEGGLNGGHRIDKGRIGQVWPGWSFIERRNAADFHAFAVQLAKRVLERAGRRTGVAWQIGA